MMIPPIPLVIDTDTGTDVDDALALMFALASPELDLIGVTVVDANVDVRAQLVSRLLGMAGRADIPVVKGENNPIGAGRMPTWFGHEGRGILDLDYDGPVAPIQEVPAADWLVQQSHEKAYHLAAIGPFTNVARAFQQDPTLKDRLLGLTVMGGMAHPETYIPTWQKFFQDTGILPAHLDHNTASDVEAALQVARAGAPMTWVTAELTFCTYLNKSAIERFRATGTLLGAALAQMLQIWNDEWFHFIPQFPDYPSPFPPTTAACLHDPLAIASIFGAPQLTLRNHALRFGIEGHLFRLHEVGQAAAEVVHPVSVAVDDAAFEAFFMERVEAYLQNQAWRPSA
ncbi:MAG: hypothetical protein HC915_09855 [Anaerolineae bacterium]|nr:hypothetical protein [Anaerolineae bacterium]